MKKSWPLIALFVAGFGCGQLLPDDTLVDTALAQEADCGTWEVRRDEVPDDQTITVSGWTPFAASSEYDAKFYVASRRCLD